MTSASGAEPSPPWWRRLAVFFELGKLKIVELWLGFFVGASLLGPRAVEGPRPVAVLALILVVGVAVIAATCSLDDIAGVRDGVDRANHSEGARWGVSKPILTGRLDEAGAFSFVRVLGVVAAAGLAAVLTLAWPLPGWFVVATLAMMLVAVNYSYGLKLSYHGAGEAVIFLGGFGTVMVPYALVAKTVTPTLLFEALLVGAWHAQVVMFSNTKDAAGDRSTGRMTLAARTSPRGNKIYIATAFVAFWSATAFAFAAGTLPPSAAVALAPVWAMQGRQLWLGVGAERWLDARLLGFRTLRVGILALTLLNLWLTRGP